MLDSHMHMSTSVPSCNVRLLVTVGVRYGSTVVAARARPKAIDCEVDYRRHRTLCVRILKYVPSSQRRCWSGVRKLICPKTTFSDHLNIFYRSV